MSQICAVHLGPNGATFTTRDQAKQEFKKDMGEALVSGLTKDSSALKNAYMKLRSSRFHSSRDMSHTSKDIQRDGNRARRGRWLSPTRDIMKGPAWEGQFSQELFHTGDDSSIPYFGRNDGAGFDRDRFVREYTALRNRGMTRDSKLPEFPDFDSDEAMYQIFSEVRNLALNEAQSRRIEHGDTNRVVDAAPGLYLFSELLNRTNILIEEDFTELWARRIFAIRNLNTWMPQWLFRRVDARTTLPEYVDIERLPGNAPRGSENVDGEVRNLAFYHHAAAWSKLELARWAEAQSQNGAASFSIDRSRIDNAIRMMNFKEDLITFFGDDDRKILGLFSAQDKTDIRRVTATAAAGGLLGSGSTERDRQILTSQVKRIREETESVLQPDTLMLSTRSFLYVIDKLYGSVDSEAGNNKTVLQMAEQTLRNMGIKDILEVPEVGFSSAQETRLKAQGLTPAAATKYAGGVGDGKQAMVICNRSAAVGEMIVAKDRVMFPTEERQDRVETRMMQGSGGLAVYKPAGYTIMTDVGPLPTP